MPSRLLAVPYGPAAVAALAAVVAEAKGGDVLAPVTVVVPSATVGVTLRRRLAVDAGGLAGVAFRSLPQVAAQLAGPALTARPALPGAVHAAHVRAVLADARPPLAAMGANAAAEAALAVTFAELAEVTEDDLAAIAVGSARAAEVVRLHRLWRSATAAFADPATLWAAASVAVEGGTAPLGELGPFVVHLPRRLRPAELDLLATLAHRHPLVVLVGRTGVTDADAPARALLGRLRIALACPITTVGDGSPRAAVPTTVVRAPDPAEEAAIAVRTVVEAVAGGVRPERVAVVSRVRDPYAGLLHEGFAAAGIDHHGPAVATLTQTVAGRTLLGLLALPDEGFARSAVIDWCRSGPVLDPATGANVPAATWDHLARSAGVIGGRAQWAERLAIAAEERRAAMAEWGDPVEDDRRLLRLAALAAFVAALATDLDAAPVGSWPALVGWADALLARYLGDDERVASWADTDPGPGPGGGAGPEAEVRAHRTVVETLRSLAALDGIGPPPTPADLRRVLATELDRPAGAVGRFGHGVTFGRPLDVAGADLDLVIVLGLAEGDAPPRRPDDALVPARERAAAGGALAPRGLGRDEEHRDFLAALAAAPRRVISFARVDPRAMRERQPSRWLLAGVSALAGRRVSAAGLDPVANDPANAGWFVDAASFEWWLAVGRPPATEDEAGRAALLAAHRAGVRVPGLLAHPVAAADPALTRGLLAAHHRTAGGFDAWNGRVAGAAELVTELGTRPQSPTGLETWAGCPFRFFLGHVLRVRGVEDPTDSDEVASATLGTLVHAIFERLVAERGPTLVPGAPWSADDRDRALAIADDEASALVAAGRTGHPLLWRMLWDQVRRHLAVVLDDDDRQRAALGTVPVAVELGFGLDGDGAPVEITLPSQRRVRFKGRIDRVDRTADGRHLSVIDYKTGHPEPYKSARYEGDGEGDLTASGTKLQLPIYALAARQTIAGGDPEVTVDTHYRWVDHRHPVTTFGGPFDDAAADRLVEVLDVVTEGIEAGRFPARPGKEEWGGTGVVHGECRWCDFDAICPSTRGERWEAVRRDPALARYVTLADGAPPDPVEATDVSP